MSNMDPTTTEDEHMTRILAILAMLESSNNPDAVNGKAVGLYQITPIVIADMNAKHGTAYQLKDRRDPVKAREIATLYIRTYAGPRPTIHKAAGLWRCGPVGMRCPTVGQQRYINKAVAMWGAA